MAIVIESVSTQAYTAPTGNDITITKPSGLSVGDLMIAAVTHFADISNGSNLFVTPSGWSAGEGSNLNIGSDGGAYAIFYKVADSSDVAASNFTFSVVGGQDFMGGCILRVSGIRTDVTELGGSDAQSLPNTDNPSYTISLAPAQNTILYVATFFSGATPYNTTNVTINGTNPTWTQQFETTRTIDVDARFEVFTALDSTPGSSITTLTPTETGSGAGTESVGSLSFFLGQNDASATLVTTENTNTALAPAGSAGAHVSLAATENTNTKLDPTGRSSNKPAWINNDKVSSVITNKPKD